MNAKVTELVAERHDLVRASHDLIATMHDRIATAHRLANDRRAILSGLEQKILKQLLMLKKVEQLLQQARSLSTTGSLSYSTIPVLAEQSRRAEKKSQHSLNGEHHCRCEFPGVIKLTELALHDSQSPSGLQVHPF
jgi:hypothetical protein